MNGIVNKLAEVGIDLSFDNIVSLGIFNSRNDVNVYNVCILDKSKLILVGGDFDGWGMGVFEVDKVNRTTTKTSFEERHSNENTLRIKRIDVEDGIMRVVGSDYNYKLACAIFLKS